MIDFPASPTNGQVFSSTNGVVYKWSASVGAWLAQTPPPVLGGTGQVTVSLPTWTIPSANVDVVIPLATVQNGNAGLWWNTTTFRYTPPAGSYFLSLNASAQSSSSAGAFAICLRKNGVRIPAGYTEGQCAAGGVAGATYGVYVDANGTDYFDWVININPNIGWYNGFFSAFPLSGIQGPTGGPPGPVVGDFHAYANTAFPTFGPGTATVIPNTVLTGNSGGWYNTTTGRYTPPAGRYILMAGAICTNLGPGGSNTSLNIRKNGADIGAGRITASGGQVLNATGYYGDPQSSVLVDANGTDFFEMVITTTASACQISNYWFLAFPTQGMVGPQGPPGVAGGTGTGQVTAISTATTALVGGTDVVIPFATVQSGNAGLWWSTATNRYTPPAGLYFISANIAMNNAGGGNATATLKIRKNGTAIGAPLNVSMSSGFWGGNAVGQYVDANGTDFFDVVVNLLSGSAATSVFDAIFSAFPLGGMQGMQGLPGAPGAPGTPGTPGNITRNQLSGFIHTHPGGTQSLTIGAGQCSDSTNAVQINLPTAMTKQLQAGWTAGNNGGGAGTVVLVGPNQWYYPFAIIVNGQPDWYLDNVAAGSAVNRPTGTTAWRRLRPIKTDGSSNIIAHTAKGNLVQWTSAVLEYSGYNLGNAGVDLVATLIAVPPGIPVLWYGRCSMTTTGAATSLVGINIRTPGTTKSANDYALSGMSMAGGSVYILTDTNQSVIFASPSFGITGSLLTAYTDGFIDDCGRFD